ncbi:hypothetical protein B0T16DRAFT_328879 [Cercophora newfieldiana]|uniref:CRIB domain-containing protein n=1 Tax=Cercophora newfieldiana TaxID=92897 RepID=A0AA40CP41_9PEZI|nr:hypothetical protein B0T16DRAFT_328879 [Cercophora newfieldiana]
MNMWAVSDLPAYTVARDARRKPEKKSKYSLGRGRSNSSATLLLPHSPGHSRRDSDSIRGLLEPAIEGPPSPETIRALNNQMRQSSGREREKHQSQQSSHTTTSSGSSSLLSLASADRPSWENALDGLSLSRKSSGRSVTNAMPSRERPDSVQIFSKTLFNRRGKLKRESSAPTSSGSSSLYSADGVTDGMSVAAPTSAPVRDSLVPAFFNRRRTATLDNVEENPRRRLQISGPYNFQHVAHTQKDTLPGLQRVDRASLTSEFSHIRSSQVPAPGTLKGIRADDLHFADFSSDFLPLPEETEQQLADEPRARAAFDLPPSMVPKQLSPPRRTIKHSKSQEQLRMPPPRPPRSPIDPAMGLIQPTPPVPPPRISSRTSIRPDGFDSLGAIVLDRPQTSSGFRHVQSSFPLTPEATSPPATSHGYFPGPDMDTIPEHAHARAPSFSDDSNWPLPCASSPLFDTAALPDVPEEDESVVAMRRSRISIASNSSLRGSQSVPMLRPLSIPPREDNPRRPASNSSDTLGRFDLLAAQRALKAALIDGSRCQSLARESWEDDIDYCYEHAAEADCDFAWDRPSLDISRDCDSTTPVEDQFRTCEGSPAMLTPGQFDVPALSPVSQISCATAHEAITPTLALPKASNFSLPRNEPPSSLQLPHVRKPSDASSFKESHGFTLSPSLLIPNDYQQQMLAAEADAREFVFHPYDEPSPFETSGLHTRYRTSASTTGTIESSHSGFEKHISAASSSTDFTRLSASTGSLDLESVAVKSEPFPLLEVSFRGESKGAMPTLPESEEAVSMAPRMARSSESNLIKLAAAEPNKRKDSIHARRQRARTTSLSTPPPPNQYALFPSTHLGGARI